MFERYNKPEALQVQPVDHRSCSGAGTTRAGSETVPETQLRRRTAPWLLPRGQHRCIKSCRSPLATQALTSLVCADPK